MISVDEITKAFTDAGYPTRASAAPLGGNINLDEIKKAFTDAGYPTSGSTAAPKSISLSSRAPISVNTTFGGALPESISLSSRPPQGALTKLKVPRSSRGFAMMDDAVNAIRGIPGKLSGLGGTQYMKNLGKLGGRAVPLFIALDAAAELTDQNDPFQKNLAEGLGKAGGTVGGAWGGGLIGGALAGATAGTAGGPLAAATVPIGAILGAILMSDVGKKLAGGAYTAINPRGELDHYIRQLDKQKEYQLARDSINRELAMTRAKDQQTMDLEAAVLNKLLGN